MAERLRDAVFDVLLHDARTKRSRKFERQKVGLKTTVGSAEHLLESKSEK